MRFIGLLMVADEDDILERTLATNLDLVDCFYALDGTDDNRLSEDICKGSRKCWGYWTDADLPKPPFTHSPVDGYRRFLHDQAVVDHGPNNWFLLLHGDEVWTFDPRTVISGAHDGYVFPLPFYFPRAGEKWDKHQHPLDQLAWSLGPGWPEFRMFRGNPHVRYDYAQHFNVRPRGIESTVTCEEEILHYPYRAPKVQRSRAQRHERTQFDPDNYQHIVDRDEVYWTDDMIGRAQNRKHSSELRVNQIGVI